MPRLLLDKEKCLRNIEKMARKAAGQKLAFRPHCKTHQSAEIGNWFRDFGVSAITVSSFEMAGYFARAGWKDILVAFPFHPGVLADLITLSEITRLSILVDSPAGLPFLHHIPGRIDFYIDIDTGYGRTGIRTENQDLIEQILIKAGTNPHLEFRGFYCHAGHSYKTTGREELDPIHQKALDDLGKLKEEFGSCAPRFLYGDTPNCSLQKKFGPIDEITPGNFVFYDLIQCTLGSCRLEDIAVAVECPVAGRYPAEERMVVHGGAVHFSKESLLMDGTPVYGQRVQRTREGWAKASETFYLTALSQEHGVMEHCNHLIREVNIGDKLLFLPVHSCLTANLMSLYHTLEGEQISTMNT